MRYTINTLKARKMYQTSKRALTWLPVMTALFLTSTALAIYTWDIVPAVCMTVFGIGCMVNLLIYMKYRQHTAVRYIAVSEHENNNILCLKVRTPVGSHYDGIQEAYFEVKEANGQISERVLGLVTEQQGKYMEQDTVDLTKQILFLV